MRKSKLPEFLQNLPEPIEMDTLEIEEELAYFEENLENKMTGELKRYKGLEIMDTGVKEWLEESGTISREDEDSPYRINYPQYFEFQRKMKLLDILKSRRQYKKKKENKQEEIF